MIQEIVIEYLVEAPFIQQQVHVLLQLLTLLKG